MRTIKIIENFKIIEAFDVLLEGNHRVAFSVLGSKTERYYFIRKTLVKFRLELAPLFVLEKGKSRKPYPINWEEQKLLVSELTVDLANAFLFMVNTGLRDQELCSLRWGWQAGEDLFILPEAHNKPKKISRITKVYTRS